MSSSNNIKKYYILFSQYGKLKPKLYKTMKSVEKNILQSPQYKVRQYSTELQANHALMIYSTQHTRYSLNIKKQIIQNKINSLSTNNLIINQHTQSTNSNTNNQNINHHQQQTLLQNKLNNTNIKPINKQPSNPNLIQPRTIQQLQQERKSLLTLTPSMPKLLHYHFPTRSFHPIYPQHIYTGYFDGCSKFNPGPSSVGYYMNFKQQPIFQACWPLGTKTNNQSQFLALFYLLVDAYTNGIRRLSLFGDSKLVVDISTGKMKASNVNIVDYAQGVKKMLGLFPYWRLQFVQRKYNTRADKLSNDGLKKKLSVQKGVY